MNRAFVDTQAWYALTHTGEATHEATRQAIASYSISLVTTTFVLSELVALLVGRRGHEAAAQAGIRIRNSPDIALVHPDEHQMAAAWQRFLERPDKDYSLIDCLSFVVMEELDIDTAITEDRHFRQEGFTVLPADGA